MDKTLFELVPVSVKPEKDDWYWVQNESNNKYFRNSAKYEDGAWWDYLDVGTGLIEVYNITHYLRPLTPPVAEERTFTLAEMKAAFLRAYSLGHTCGQVDEGYYDEACWITYSQNNP